MQKISRNDPCYCGSGKKYKYCHLIIDAATKGSPIITGIPTQAELDEWGRYCDQLAAQGIDEFPTLNQWRGKSNAASGPSQHLGAFLKNHEFNDLDEARSAIKTYISDANNFGIDDFMGISPRLMFDLQSSHFDEMQALVVLQFSKFKEPQKRIPLLNYARLLLARLSEAPIKLTAAGFLPPSIVACLYESFITDFTSTKYSLFVTKNINERQVMEFMYFRETLVLLGLIKKRTGEITLTKLGTEFMKLGPTEQFKRLIELYLYKCDWIKIRTYLSVEIPQIVQQSWLFGMYLAHKMGKKPIPKSDFEKAFTRAFPMIESMFVRTSNPNFSQDVSALPTFYYLDAFGDLFGFFEPQHPANTFVTSYEVTEVFKDLFSWKTIA